MTVELPAPAVVAVVWLVVVGWRLDREMGGGGNDREMGDANKAHRRSRLEQRSPAADPRTGVMALLGMKTQLLQEIRRS